MSSEGVEGSINEMSIRTEGEGVGICAYFRDETREGEPRHPQ